jgi:hypothetical protein
MDRNDIMPIGLRDTYTLVVVNQETDSKK